MNATAETAKARFEEIPPSRLRLVVAASTAGTTFEWYDFFLGVPLAGIIAKLFFAGLGDTAGYLFALLSFGAGFAFRPLGALVFGRMGDRLGRKATFLITTTLMGGATFAIGLLPTAGQIDTNGLDVDAADMAELLSVDRAGWQSAIPQIREHFAKFGDRLPDELLNQLDRLEKSLAG